MENKGNFNIKDSQNFLYDEKLVSKLISNSNINSKDIVYEIGPGKGIITKKLATVCKKIIAIELDCNLAKTLKDQFKNVPNVEIVCTNFLSYNIYPNNKFKFFSNIPFNITTEILLKVLNLKGIQDIYFIMQYEAFLKYSGLPYYKESLRSLLYKPFFETKIIYKFKATDFTPVPNAKIILAHFSLKEKPDISIDNTSLYKDFLAFIFSENGETLKEKSKRIFSYKQLKQATKNIGIPMTCSITEITYEQWLVLFEIYLKYVPNDKKGNINGSYNQLLNKQKKLKRIHKNRIQNRKANRYGKRKTN